MKKIFLAVAVSLTAIVPAFSLAQVIEKSYAQAADCTNDAKMTLTASIPADGDYKIWVLMRKTSDMTSAGIAVQGGECREIAVPSSSEWEWVSGEDSIIESLTAGSKEFVIGVGSGSAQFDKVLATDNTACEPTGDGGNCLENPLTVALQGIGEDEPQVNGERVIEAVAVSKPSENAVVTVEFYIDDILINSDNSAPYCAVDGDANCSGYDFAALSDDTHTLRIVATSNDQHVEQERQFTKSSEAPTEPPVVPTPTPNTPQSDDEPVPTTTTPPAVNIPDNSSEAPADLPDLTIALDGVNEGDTISGTKNISASVPQTASATVSFTLSGRIVNRDSEAPYCMESGSSGCTSWDSNSIPNGEYELVVRATANGYDATSLTRKVKISNTAPVVARANPTTTQNVVVGTPNQQVSGPVKVTVPAAQIKPGSTITYKVDNKEIAKTTAANPSAVISTGELSNGKKTISATIKSPNGSKSTVAGNVTVRNDKVTSTSNWFRENMVLFVGMLTIGAVGTFFAVRWLMNWYKMRQLTGDHNLADTYRFVMPEEQAMGKQYAAAGVAVFAVFALGAFGVNLNRTQAAVGAGFMREAEESVGNFAREMNDQGMTYATLTAMDAPDPAPPTDPGNPTDPNPPTDPVTPTPPATNPPAPSNADFTFVGNLNGGSEVVSFRKDPSSGALTRVSSTAGANYAYFAHHPNMPIIYAVYEYYAGGYVAAMRYDKQTGSLTEIDRSGTLGRLSTHVSITPNGSHLIVANYSGASWSLVKLNPDGSIDNETHRLTVTHPASTPGRGRQDASHPHGTKFDPSGTYAVATDLGTDTVDVFRIVDDRIVSVDTMNLAPGTGPRQASFSADGRFIYVLGELNSSVNVFSFDAGTGNIGFQIDTENVYDGGVWAAEILTHPSGDYVFATNRDRNDSTSGENAISSFRIDRSNGMLTKVGSFMTNGVQPRTMGFDPSGNWLYALNNTSGSITQFRINTSNGTLEQVGSPLGGVPAAAGIIFSRP